MAKRNAALDRRGLGLAGRGAGPRDPGHLGGGPRHHPRCRLGRRDAGGDGHADLFRLPGDNASSISISSGHCDDHGVDKVRLQRQLSPAWTTDWISAEGREKLRDLRHRAAGRRHRRRRGSPAARVDRLSGRADLTIACPRCGSTRHREDQPVRLHALQGELSLHRLPGTFRLFQVHLSRRESRPVARFHSLAGHRRPPRNARCGGRHAPARATRTATLFDFTQGQYLTFRRKFDGEELRRSYSICAGRDEGALKVGIKRVDGGASPPGRTRN